MLNILCLLLVNPNISAYEAVHGPYNWNCFPLAPPDCKAVVYKSPKTQGSWGSRGIDAWCLGPSLDYQCNHFFIPETQAYWTSCSSKLFPQYCQVPFLLWKKHLQEVIDELITTLKELPGPKRSGVLDNIKSRLEINDAQLTKRTLTSHTDEWLLPQGDLQRVPIAAHPEQRVEQRVTPVHHADAPPLQGITGAPPIMAAPNPTARHTLKLTTQTHSRQTRNKNPGSVPELTSSPSAQRPLPDFIPAAMQMSQTPRQSPRTHTQSILQMPGCIPRVRFQTIPGGLRNSDNISQEAINFLTTCVWAQSPDIFTPKKLMPAAMPTCLDFEQVATQMMHPVTGKAISSYT
jgi:hypothetical protein